MIVIRAGIGDILHEAFFIAFFEIILQRVELLKLIST
jgi:hypothetical protein